MLTGSGRGMQSPPKVVALLVAGFIPLVGGPLDIGRSFRQFDLFVSANC